MQVLGRCFNEEWMLPVRALSLRVIFKKQRERETWTVSYSMEKQEWVLNDAPIANPSMLELSFEGIKYFLALAHPSEEFLHGIEEVASIILKARKKERSLKSVLAKLYATKGRGVQPAKHYESLLEHSKCFIKMTLEDTMGHSCTRWRVNKAQLKNFRKIKASTQTIIVEVVDQKESVSLFYATDTASTPSQLIQSKEQR
ncbi:hypothetical protein NEDG_00256 [Nematocida displodere]|uniref:Uncharacterized protein n=1 Tax=Nematocida displodere TaxID=1805483 RepID=A0A177EJZ2_9MICR|nr:hypothetical protein NEDG_00256 [Nematocida displodere]